jgi:Zn-dependent peptidase ImmA (M78 family)
MSKLTEILERAKQSGKLSRIKAITGERLLALSGGAEPTMAEVRLLAQELKIDPQDLLQVSKRQQDVDFLFRDAQGKADYGTLAKLSRTISNSLDLLPEREIAGPWWLGQFKKQDKTFEEAEENARKFRALFGGDDQVGPLLLLPELIANKLGILLFLIGSAKVDGASAFFEGIPYIFISDRFRPRMLFTLAHELGHIIAHHADDKAFIAVDLLGQRAKPKKNLIEFYAHAFASCLLMPAQGVAIALDRIQAKLTGSGQDQVGDLEISWLARIYGVSFYAAARRCEDLKLLPRGGAASLEFELKRKFGSAERRGDLANLPPRPAIEFPAVPEPLLVSAIERIRAGEISIGKASEALGLSLSDLLKANAPPIN